IVDLAIAACALAAIALPIALVYFRLQREHGFTRSIDELSGLSARLTDYLRVDPAAWSWRGLLAVGDNERQLFHGFAALGFAALAAVAARSRTVITYLIVALVAVWLSMGLGGGPAYGWLFDHVPGFNGLRVPARFASVVVVGLSVAAGAGFAWVL